MSAYIKRSTYKDESILIECSICSAGISPKKTQEINDTFRFCWHCGVKFGPEPKPEPTEGTWYHDEVGGAIRTMPYGITIAHVMSCKTVAEMRANAHVMAASKKLLAALRLLIPKGREDYHYIGAVSNETMRQAIEAIAEAEGQPRTGTLPDHTPPHLKGKG